MPHPLSLHYPNKEHTQTKQDKRRKKRVKDQSKPENEVARFVQVSLRGTLFWLSLSFLDLVEILDSDIDGGRHRETVEKEKRVAKSILVSTVRCKPLNAKDLDEVNRASK